MNSTFIGFANGGIFLALQAEVRGHSVRICPIVFIMAVDDLLRKVLMIAWLVVFAAFAMVLHQPHRILGGSIQRMPFIVITSAPLFAVMQYRVMGQSLGFIFND